MSFIWLLLNTETIVAQPINIAPRPQWVKQINFDFNTAIKQGKVSEGYYYFIKDFQVDVSSHTYYTHRAYKIFNADGVHEASTLYFSYSPSYEKLIIHSIKVHRNGEIIDKTNNSKMSLIQREEGLENNLYSGDKTLNVILNDIQPKDIIEYDYSVIGDNPIFSNKFFYSFYLNGYYDLLQVYYRIIKPSSLKLNINYSNHYNPPVIEKSGNKEILVWDFKNLKGFESENNSPSWYDPYLKVEISEYFSWEEVVKWGLTVFKNDNNSEILKNPRIKEIAALKNDELKILKALAFVQNDIRYFGIEIGANSHKPKNTINILRDGYGDCKDKTSLLCNILNNLNIKAYPVLVHTDNRFSIVNGIPSPGQFNHVTTLIKLNGKNIYLDPTISEQGGKIGSVYYPNYGYGLILKDSIKELTYLSSKRISDIKLKEVFSIKDILGKTDLLVKTYYSGYEADIVRYKYANSNLSEIEDKYKEFYVSKFKDVEIVGKLNSKDDKEANLYTTTENYKIKRIWDKESNDVYKVNFSGHFIRESLDEIDVSTDTRKSPLYLAYPNRRVHVVEVELPRDWNIIPENIVIQNKYIWYKRKLVFFKRKLKIEYTLHILRTEVEPSDYVSFKDDIDKIYNDLGYEISWNQKLSKNIESSNINWLIVLLALLFGILVALAGIFVYRKLTTNPMNEVPRRIGGWLVLPVIGLCLSFILILFSFFTNSYFDKGTWLIRTDETSVDYISGFSGVLILELCMNIILFSYAILLLTLTFKYNRYAPKLFIVYYITVFVFSAIDNTLVYTILKEKNIGGFARDVIRTSGSCAIWIPYFLTSKRVKETFVC